MSNKALLGALLLVAAGCGDAAVARPGADPLECSGAVEQRTLRVDRLDVPVDSSTGDALGRDLDGDGTPDNQIANIVSWLVVGYPDVGTSMAPRVQRRIDGDTVWLIELSQCDNDARVTLARGEDRAPGRVHVVVEGEIPAGGPSVDGNVDAVRGIGIAPIGAIADLGDTGFDEWNDIDPSDVHLTLGDGEATGTFDGGLTGQFDDLVARAFLPYLQARLDAGDTEFGADADVDHDGILSEGELRATSVWQTLLRPDTDTDGDGQLDVLSYGFGFHAVDVDVE